MGRKRWAEFYIQGRMDRFSGWEFSGWWRWKKETNAQRLSTLKAGRKGCELYKWEIQDNGKSLCESEFRFKYVGDFEVSVRSPDRNVFRKMKNMGLDFLK